MIEPELCEICGEELDPEFDSICGDCQKEREREAAFDRYMDERNDLD